MSIDFNLYRPTSSNFDLVAVPEHLEVSVGSANGIDLLDALGIEETCSSEPWRIERFRALVTVARRKRLGYQSPTIPSSERSAPNRPTFIDVGRHEGYIERRLDDLARLLSHGSEVGATHIGWG